MIFSREYVGYLARHTVKHLIDAKMIQTAKVTAVEERVYSGLLEELSLEDRINEEVRVILDAYQEEMRRTGASYSEMFKKVKTELARKYKAVLNEASAQDRTRTPGARPTLRISTDKLNKLGHVVADTLADTPEADFLEDRNTIRQESRKALEHLLLEEMRIDEAARKKIETQRKIIPEGSQEWDILYRKYYNEEVKKLGI
jgi:uncharacterized protein